MAYLDGHGMAGWPGESEARAETILADDCLWWPCPKGLLVSGDEQLSYADAARVLRALCVERLRNLNAA